MSLQLTFSCETFWTDLTLIEPVFTVIFQVSFKITLYWKRFRTNMTKKRLIPTVDSLMHFQCTWSHKALEAYFTFMSSSRVAHLHIVLLKLTISFKMRFTICTFKQSFFFEIVTQFCVTFWPVKFWNESKFFSSVHFYVPFMITVL